MQPLPPTRALRLQSSGSAGRTFPFARPPTQLLLAELSSLAAAATYNIRLYQRRMQPSPGGKEQVARHQLDHEIDGTAICLHGTWWTRPRARNNCSFSHLTILRPTKPNLNAVSGRPMRRSKLGRSVTQGYVRLPQTIRLMNMQPSPCKHFRRES